jgi:hypothetical protein
MAGLRPERAAIHAEQFSKLVVRAFRPGVDAPKSKIKQVFGAQFCIAFRHLTYPFREWKKHITFPLDWFNDDTIGLFTYVEKEVVLALEDVMLDVHEELKKLNTNFQNFGKPAIEETKTNGAEAPRRGRPPKTQNDITVDMVRAACNKVFAEKGKAVTTKMIREVGGAPKIAEIDPSKYSAVLAACDVILNAEPAPAEAEGEEDEGL